jgi:1-acyl-sn-glycerol-3-phosphate acyltransferase
VTTLFRPLSLCGPGCLPPDDGSAVGAVRRSVRLVATLSILIGTAGAGAALTLANPERRAHRARAILRHTARAMFRTLGIDTATGGATLPTTRALVIANHVSWLDILALLATTDVRIVAKSEVGRWPIIGRLARLSGVIFIDRGRPLSLPHTVTEVRDALRAGDVVAVFAEGTTSCGAHPMEYRPALFQAAIDTGTRVVPVTLRYLTADGTPTAGPAFIGDETLVTSMRRVLAARSLHLDLRAGAALHPDAGTSRRMLARAAAATTPVALSPVTDLATRRRTRTVIPAERAAA